MHWILQDGFHAEHGWRQPHEAFVIDVGDSEAGLKIVEINTLNSSAFYAADVQRLVLALEERFGR